ncbi:amidohydrolase family protein [uncultured Paludibaculum sp.]|uniref:amidohydrolase family protein n=1 Tax=uncultured Paludibaculum sp. TaxID=1765020 RepID=UPI002AAB8E39|nr:amidohydrolase family protein [uncultured Paludibaculum sp.]
MNRRTFLGAAAALPALVGQQRSLDAHTHFYDPSRAQGVPWPAKDNSALYRTVLPPEFQKLTRTLGVEGTIAVEASPWLEDNQWVLDLAQRYPVIRGFVGHLDPGRPGFAANLDRFRKHRLFLGIRIGGALLAGQLRNQAFLADMRRLADADLELDVLGGPAPYADTARLSDRVPGLRVVLDHLPNDAPKDPAALWALKDRPNIYGKVSGVVRRVDGRVVIDAAFYRESLDQLWAAFGEDRLVYASNWPVSDLLAPYAQVLHVVQAYFASKRPIALEKFFWSNAHKAYRVPG